jgi:ATP-dependent DNA helicase RecQ
MTGAARAPARRKNTGKRIDDTALRRTLRDVFGIRRLRPGQEDVIRAVIAGRDALAIMPTGAGKSLCYQLPALHLAGVTLVVSPLIALMKDQADTLAEAGIPVAQVNSTFSDTACREALGDVVAGKVKIAFITPERLTDPDTLRALERATIARVVVDEAHCICQWGHDFRPAFLDIPNALAALRNPPVLALTATATDAMADDIRASLARPSMKLIQTAMYRANLHYRVDHISSEDQRVAKVLDLVRSLPGAGIVYVATLRCLEALHDALAAADVPVLRYHGKLGARERNESQDAFMRGDARVMVATNAFGLGVDKPDIRFVIHAQMPGNLEAYYQESGRAGRDGEAAQCILLYDLRDRRTQQFFLVRRYPDADQVAAVQDAIAKHEGAPVSLETLRAALPHIAASKVKVAARLLALQGVVARTRNGELRLARPAIDAEQVGKLASVYSEREEEDREKLERMVFYAQTGHCRWRVLLDYFGESLGRDRCDTCDNCRRAREHAVDDAVSRIVSPMRLRREYSNGDRVRIPRVGEGIVRGLIGNEVTVELADGTTRTFLRSYVRRATGGVKASRQRTATTALAQAA